MACFFKASWGVAEHDFFKQFHALQEVTHALLKEQGIAAQVLQSEEAVRLFNQLQEREALAGLFHLTY